ncbi:MAG: DUF167 domain-containing protein [Phycisphaera sp.]|nr:DUF167 domain-containing protein [Phycisphaera sp.]
MARIPVKVVPGAKRDEIAGWLGEALKVRVSAPPEKGKANEAVRGVIARALGVPVDAVVIVSGHTSPRKGVEVCGVGELEIRERLKHI